MLYLLLFLAGMLGGIVLGRVLGKSAVRQPAGAPAAAEPPVIAPAVAPPAVTPPVVEEAPKPQPSRGEAIGALQSQVEAAGEASSHPRDMQHNAAFRQAVELFAAPDTPLDLTLGYATGANWEMSTAALAALCVRADREQAVGAVIANFPHVRPWPLFFALELLRTCAERPPLGALLLRVPEWWAGHSFIPAFLAEHFEACAALGDRIAFDDTLASMTPQELAPTSALLKTIQHVAAAALLEQLAAWQRARVDREFLLSFGRIWDAQEQMLLVEHASIKDALALAETSLSQEAPRSLIVVAESGAGKTSFLKLVGSRLMAEGWTVFEAGAGSLIAGTEYIGQLEERLRRLIVEVGTGKRVLWYVPDLLQLARSGTHRGQAASILDQIFGAITGHKITLVSEITPAGLTKLLQLKNGLRGAVEIVRLPELDAPQVRDFALAVSQRLIGALEIGMPTAVVDSAIHLTRHCFGSSQMPGAVIDVLKLAAQHVVANDGPELTERDLLHTLSQLTGMPASILDDREQIDLAAMRRFFAARVIGQDEAVGAVVDRVAMLKAGLCDPSRPIGVFLFAGPTGTGKTELAKALAEFLFSASERLVRLDMSEFQGSDSRRKILGDPGDDADADSLTQRIRKQPFALVLLDEFEKAHPSIWDLFLQVFDDGRLTDANGHTVDFRHCILILTSNLGATAHESAGIGFSAQQSAFSREQVLRAVAGSFRPEFVNRLDRVIVFKPLTRELMQNILQKELTLVLERRGLKNREWAVEWEASALEFLLDRGFSQSMGARPLKRAIDQYLLAPLAGTIVEHRFPTGEQFLFVRSDGQSIQVEFVDPDAPATSTVAEELLAPARATTLGRMILQPAGTPAERTALIEALRDIETTLQGDAWESQRSGYSDTMRQNTFWERSDRHTTLARYARMDRIDAAVTTARGLATRLDRSASAGRYSRDLTARLALQIYLLQHGLEDVRTDAPIEVALMVAPAMDSARDRAITREWCERLSAMYRGWAAARLMQYSDMNGAAGSVLLVSGFGAARLLFSEQGLHVQEIGTDDAQVERVSARVKVLAVPDDGKEDHRKQVQIEAALQRAPSSSTIVRRYRFGSAPLVREPRSSRRTGRAAVIMDGHFDLLEQIGAE